MAEDARSKLEEALANAKARHAKGPASAPSPPPPRSAPARSTSSASSKPAPKPKKAKAPKKKGPGLGNVLGKKFSTFASTVVDELKSATSEISPGALIASATDGLQSIKKAVGFDEEPIPESDKTETKQSAETAGSTSDSSPADGTNDTQKATSSLALEPDPAPAPAPEATSEAPVSGPEVPEEATPPDDQSVTDGPAGLTSPSKVQRAPSKKKATEDEDEDEDDSDKPPAPSDETPSNDTSKPSSEQSETPDKAEENSTISKPPPKPVVVSKTEHSVRTFQALQTVLTNPVWAPIVTDLTTKPSSLFAPRAHFDTQFTDPVFRDGLKAACRLATTYAFEPEKIEFNEKIIERVNAIELDPDGKIKPHTESITSVIAPETTEKVLDMLDNGHVKRLLFSAGTRLGSFVPTIESLARIYVTLRKKTELSSGDRLQIQEEIMMRYKKAPYTDEMGKKARNLALNYFMDYVAESGFKLYLDRLNNTPEGQDNTESHYRRYNTIISFCHSTIEEWCSKIAISTQAIESIQNKFNDLAGDHFRETVGEPPSQET